MQSLRLERSHAPDDIGREARRAAAKRIDRVNEWLSVGGALGPEEYERLRDAGITDVVDLREAGPDDAQRLEALGLAWHHLAVPDQSAPNMGQLIAIGSQLQARKFSGRVYIHCGGGFIAAL